MMRTCSHGHETIFRSCPVCAARRRPVQTRKLKAKQDPRRIDVKSIGIKMAARLAKMKKGMDVNPKIAAKWIEADQYCKTHPVPVILAQEAAKRAKVAMRKARMARPAIRLPRGEKKETLPQLKKELDRVFSIFIRQRDCDSDGGWGSCATCGVAIQAVHSAQASHYQVRQDMATRWDERNVHAACGNCNGFRGGEQVKMSQYIDCKYGLGTAEKLQELARMPFKLNRQWLEEKIRHYKK